MNLILNVTLMFTSIFMSCNQEKDLAVNCNDIISLVQEDNVKLFLKKLKMIEAKESSDTYQRYYSNDSSLFVGNMELGIVVSFSGRDDLINIAEINDCFESKFGSTVISDSIKGLINVDQVVSESKYVSNENDFLIVHSIIEGENIYTFTINRL